MVSLAEFTCYSDPFCAFCVCVPDYFGIFPVLALAVPPLAVHDRGVHVGRREGVGFIQQRDYTQQDGSKRNTNAHTRKIS